MNILQAMKERRSVRSFDGQTVDSETRAKLLAAIDDSYTLFGGDVTIRLKTFDLKGPYKPSTYGVIKGASYFFLMAIGSNKDSELTAGFRFEQIVLRAWQMGLGTCWIAGTFKGSQFDKGEEWAPGETLKVICPVGKAAPQRTLEKVMRYAVGSNKRKPFAELFFQNDFKQPLDPNNTFAEALEMLRLAPSSTNSQPWRALVCDNKVHFYYKPKSRLAVLDCGIGLCHFYETEKFLSRPDDESSQPSSTSVPGTFTSEATYPTPPDDWQYLTTYTRQ